MEERMLYIRSQGKTLRRYMSTFHSFIMFIGLFIISIGAYHINSTISLTISLFFLVLGGMMTITSFIGLFGAQLEHTGFLNTYNGLHAIILVFELVIISIVYNYRSQILDPYASILWDFFIEHDPQFIMNTEQLLHCCGYQSITDRALPANCSLSLNTNIGCKDSIISLIKRWHQWIILILIFLLILQSTILVLSIVLDIIVERQIREEERYLTLLKQSNHNYWLGHHSNHEGPSTNSGYFGRHRASLHTQKSNNSSTFIPKYGSTPSTSSATFYQVHS